MGSGYGYLPNPSNTWLVTKEKYHSEATVTFEGTNTNIYHQLWATLLWSFLGHCCIHWPVFGWEGIWLIAQAEVRLLSSLFCREDKLETKEFTYSKHVKKDCVPVIRSFLLQLLLEYKWAQQKYSCMFFDFILHYVDFLFSVLTKSGRILTTTWNVPNKQFQSMIKISFSCAFSVWKYVLFEKYMPYLFVIVHVWI